jgi:predicted permease
MLRDIRYALRTLRGAPAFAVTVVLTLGIGLGLNTALFTLFNAYVLHPFAVKDPYNLYRFGWKTNRAPGAGLTWEQYQDLQANMPVFSDVIAYTGMLARAESRNLQGLAVSGNYFTMLGIGAAQGRPILPADAATPGARAVVVLTYQIWNAAFGGDPGIVGRTIRLSGRPFEVVGIAPPDFTGIMEVPVDFFVPITMQGTVTPGTDLFSPQKPRGALIVGRLRPEIPIEKAQAALTVWIRHATEQWPEDQRAIQATLDSQATPVASNSFLLTALLPILLPLAVVFALVLVICCANVSNMMLARALGRQREIGVRLALGAARSRLIRQLLSENLLLSLLAGMVGAAVSAGSIRGAQRLLNATLPPALNLFHSTPLKPDYRVFLFILGVATFSTILFGLAPALQATRTSLVEALRGEFGARVSSSRLRSILIVSQITVCCILLVLSGILLRSSAVYQNQDVGYKIHGIVYPLFIGRGSDTSGTLKLAQRLEVDPWVDLWAAVWHPPFFNGGDIPVKTAQGSQTLKASYNLVSPEYFKILDLPILRGRNFGGAEGDGEAPVAIVSQATADKIWPNQDALGKSITLDRTGFASGDGPRFDQAVVIGIAKDVTTGSIVKGRDTTMVYFPTSANAKRALTFLIRGKGTVAAATRQLEATLEATVPDRPVIAISLDDVFATQVYPFWAAAWIAVMLGGLALLLTLSGMYGVMSYLVNQRRKEIGIRIALGATPAVVVRLVLGQSLRFAIWGLAVGLSLAFGGALVLRHLLTVINAFDLVAYGAGAGVVALAALAAAFFPSNRAARINPLEALRAE